MQPVAKRRAELNSESGILRPFLAFLSKKWLCPKLKKLIWNLYNYFIVRRITYICSRMNKLHDKLSESEFLSFFPHIELPVILAEDTITSIDKNNKPFSKLALEYMVEWEEKELDEYTELIPCFQFPVSKEIQCLVYWKGSLLTYEYILLVLQVKDWELLSKKIIGGTKVANDTIIRSSTVISPELEIDILMNSQKLDDKDIDPKAVSKYHMEIMQDGSIISEQDEFENK